MNDMHVIHPVLCPQRLTADPKNKMAPQRLASLGAVARLA